MNFAQTMHVIQKNEYNVGGTDHVPPTVCLPPACASAHIPAYVERTGKAVTNKLDALQGMRPVMGKGLILFSGSKP